MSNIQPENPISLFKPPLSALYVPSSEALHYKTECNHLLILFDIRVFNFKQHKIQLFQALSIVNLFFLHLLSSEGLVKW